MISLLIIFLLIISNVLVWVVNAVNTNELSSPWTIEKAEHLAKKVLYWATKEKVLELYNAWNAISAVNLLFPSVNWPDRTNYDEEMSLLLDETLLIQTSNVKMREYYAFKKLNDPYEAKSKLFNIFEDTFSVDTINNRINYWDIEANHNLLYSYTLWNYKDMIKKNLYNNWMSWDYALWEYLDLFNQTNPKYPNENYAREILQLFLMLEYKPTESEDLWSIRNYTEDDVNVMAKILFWLEADENTHKVTYNADSNTNTIVEFLEWPLKSWDNFPFYNSWSWTLDIQEMKKSINWNNWLQDNIIDYIFSKRQDSIAIFLADKLYRFYISEKPTREELNLITSQIISNNFEIYPTVKWLLSNDMMYSDKSMNTTLYKNPLELIIWTSKIFWLTSEQLDLRYSLTDIGWTPYYPSKIFWRDWYDDNSIFFTPYISNKWTSVSSKFASYLIDNNLWFIEDQTSAEWIISSLENKLYLWKNLDLETRNYLLNYLTHDKDWNEINIDFSDKNYVAKNIQGLIYIMLNLPEYILQSWYDINSNQDENQNSFYNNDSKLVFIKASGWLDWLHAVVPKNEYETYLDYRESWALTWTWLTSLDDDYYINSSLWEFKKLYDSWNLKVINRVWTPNNSRWHDSASRKITSIDNTYEWFEGIFWDLITNEDPAKTIVLDWWTKPSIFNNWNYMWIGSSAIYKVYYWETSINSSEKEYKITTLKNLLKNRTYNWEFWNVFKNSAIIDDVARESVANWWREWSGYNMEQRFTFLESLYNWWLWNTTWMRADWWYDTHSNQKDYLNSNLEKVANTTSEFFNKVKDKYNVTIVIYSEFWRTNKINSSLWFDHWMAWWMFIISNNSNLTQKELPKKVYWNLLFKDSEYNWLGVWIDYRSIYSAIYKALYNYDLSDKLWSIFNINNYIDDITPETQLLWYDHKHYSWNTYYSHLKFNIDDINYYSSEWSYIQFEYWTDNDPIREVSSYTLDRSKVSEKDYDISIRTNWKTKYYYKLTIFDNQYNKKEIESYFITPNSQNELSLDNSTFLPRFKNIDLTNSIKLNESSTWIILSSSWEIEYIWDNNSKIITSSWTFIEEINWWSWAIWNWTFMNPTEVNISTFVWKNSIFEWETISKYKIEKVIKVWANSLWVWLKLNKPVKIEISDINTSNNYVILTSEDWKNWTRLENSNIQKQVEKLVFSTDHFSYFAIIQSDSNWNLITNNWTLPNNVISYSSSKSWRLTKDKCEFWDFSASYYDRTCGIELYTIHSNPYDSEDEEMYNDLKNDLKNINSLWLNYIDKKIYKSEKEMELAYVELKVAAEEKAKIYDSLFTEELIVKIEETEEENILDKELNNIEAQKEILILLREKLSFVNIWEYKLIHIKNSNLNSKFEAIAKVIVKKDFNILKTDKLFEILNQVIMYSAINEINNIDEKVKTKNKLLLKKTIKSLVDLYKSWIVIKKVTEKTIENKKETIAEKIIRINAKKKLLNSKK